MNYTHNTGTWYSRSNCYSLCTQAMGFSDCLALSFGHFLFFRARFRAQVKKKPPSTCTPTVAGLNSTVATPVLHRQTKKKPCLSQELLESHFPLRRQHRLSDNLLVSHQGRTPQQPKVELMVPYPHAEATEEWPPVAVFQCLGAELRQQG